MVVFPHAPATSVVSLDLANKVLEDIETSPENLEGVTNIDLSLEQMQDMTGKESMVGKTSFTIFTLLMRLLINVPFQKIHSKILTLGLPSVLLVYRYLPKLNT